MIPHVPVISGIKTARKLDS